MRTIFEKERLYIEILPYEIVGVATMAARDMVPVRLAGGSIRVPGISVNRRERTEDGRTILGWNPDGALDDELTVLKFADRRRPDGGADNELCVPSCRSRW